MARTPAASRNEFEAGPWRFLVVKNHILRSSCERGRENGCDSDNGDLCTVCRYVGARRHTWPWANINVAV